ncbi:MarR family winged helix-turn-helix transcriptional regulator [Psychrobacillus sp. L4]|uniref:MarR family winged helix-turn-helix transcriptional regulator n=1 Tax=Psychrobacillus sp. L4 TaxID=3236892 RepID=UPI0036F2751A
MNLNSKYHPKSSEFLHSFRRVNKGLMQFLHKIALEHDLTVPQYSLLMTIAPHKEITQKKLGEILQIPKSTLSQGVDVLVQAGWIEREPVPDNRREIQLILSEKGIMLFETINQKKGTIHQVIDSALETLPEKQCEEFQATLLHIADYLENESSTEESSKND